MPGEYDPVALRELFGPGFLAWTTTMTGEVDFGINDSQLWFLWRLGERSEEELKAALKTPASSSGGCRRRWKRAASTPIRPGPWHAGLEPFPGA